MKHLKFLFLFIVLAIFASCSESDVEGGVIGDANQAIFSGTIGELQTRVTDNSWDSGDAIGVYALMADQALSDAAIFDGKSNVKYTTSGNGTFTVAGAPINFPETGDLDFVSYYPYKTAITDYKYSIDVTSQSDMAAIDLLYSENAKGQNKSAPNVNLKFNHMLSKLEMNVQLGEDLTSLEGLTVGVKSVIVDGSLALTDGTITTGTIRKDITPKVTIASDNKTATVAAIVVPGQNLEDVTIVFSLGGKDYEWTPTAQELLSTYKYAYTIKLTLDASGEPIVVPVEIGATINDWNDPQIGDTPIVLEPEGEDPVTPGEGDGSKENPYTVAQAFANQGAPKNTDYVWIKGYIVGYKNNGGYDVEFSTTSDGDKIKTNLVIADNKDETDGTKALGVQLAYDSNARKDLNLLDNSGMYKAEVLLYGTLEKYFSDDEGLKNVAEYELVTPGEGGDTPTPVGFTTDKSTVFFNADTELTSTVKLTTDAAQAWTVASDALWLSVAPAGGSGNADVVLTATENTAETSRTAIVTITPTANTELTPIVVNVTQNGKPAAGGDFATDLFFSEYIEGSSNNKYLEIYNGTGATVDLTDYEVVLYSNGKTERGNNIQLTGTLAQGAVYVIANADGNIYSGADVTSTVTYYNGDDAIALQRISTGEYVDIIGRIGEDPGTKWSAGGDLETMDKTLVRKPSVKGGVTVNPTEGFPTLATEWIGYPVDTADYLGSHTTDY